MINNCNKELIVIECARNVNLQKFSTHGKQEPGHAEIPFGEKTIRQCGQSAVAIHRKFMALVLSDASSNALQVLDRQSSGIGETGERCLNSWSSPIDDERSNIYLQL